jgi:hypothetical protein
MNPKLSDYYPATRPNGLAWPHAPILAVQNHKLLFCPIAKNGCTSLKRLMVSLSDVEHKELFLSGDVHRGIDNHRTGLKLLDHDLDLARQIMSSEKYYKFAVIRDPFTRLVSAYLEKFVINRLGKPNQYHTGPVVAGVQGTDQPDFQRGITFAEFIRYITSQAPESLDPHWKPQVLYLAGIHYDRIYRMDQLDALCSDLASRVGHPVSLEKKNASEKSGSRFLPDAAHLYADELKRPQAIDKCSFLDSELMFDIAQYFADDYRLCVDARQKNQPAAETQRVSLPTQDPAGPPPPRDAAQPAADSGESSAHFVADHGESAITGETFRRPLLPTDTLFFLHLPKCGGTTFGGLLQQMFRRDVDVYANPYRRRELLDAPREELQSYRLIRGHFQYPDVIRKLGFLPRSVTLLRDPIARFISHYQMRKHPRWQPDNPPQRAYQAKLNSMSFEQFLECPELTSELANLQYRFLAGFRRDKLGMPVCDFNEPYARLLDNFEVVGILERFDELLEAFCFVFDFPPVTTFSNQNVSPDRDKRSQFSGELLERVAELNQHDLELYALAQHRFEQQRSQIRTEFERHPDGLPMLEQPQERIHLDMSRMPPGNNWWESTEHKSYGCVRWTGPGRSAEIHLPLTPGSKNVRLTVIKAAGKDVLRSLRLVVEGTEVPLTWKFKLKRFPRTYTGTIPGEAIPAQRRTKLSLQFSATRRPWRGAPIKAGVCVSSLEIDSAACDAGTPHTAWRRSRAA